MTQNFSSIKHLFRRTVSEKGSASFVYDAHKDWRILCGFFLVLNLLAIGIGVLVYQKVDNGDIFLVDKKGSTSPRTLNKFELEKTVLFFENREQQFETLRQRPPITIDPFIPKALLVE